MRFRKIVFIKNNLMSIQNFAFLLIFHAIIIKKIVLTNFNTQMENYSSKICISENKSLKYYQEE